MARSMISAESSSSVLPPNIMHPRQISLTFTPVLPRFLYTTIHSFEVVVALFNIPRRRRRTLRGLIPRYRVCSIAACGSGLVRQKREGRTRREEGPVGDTRDGRHREAVRTGSTLRPRCRGVRRRIALGSLGGEVRRYVEHPPPPCELRRPRLRPRRRRRLHRNPPPFPRPERYAGPPGREGRALRKALLRERCRSRTGGRARAGETALYHGGHVD